MRSTQYDRQLPIDVANKPPDCVASQLSEEPRHAGQKNEAGLGADTSAHGAQGVRRGRSAQTRCTSAARRARWREAAPKAARTRALAAQHAVPHPTMKHRSRKRPTEMRPPAAPQTALPAPPLVAWRNFPRGRTEGPPGARRIDGHNPTPNAARRAPAERRLSSAARAPLARHSGAARLPPGRRWAPLQPP